MGKNNIEKYSLGYAALKAFVAFWHNIFFYRKVIVVGLENINPEHHLIFALNHQNTLMDALAVLFTHKGQPVFLARADIFKKKKIASILYFLKILPVYRIRDGYANLKGNDEVFAKTIDVIKNKNGLIILPEGNHDGHRRLRQLKKGICRVAFQADEIENNQLKIKIIPVGLEYSDYQKYRQVLTVVYGKPIEVSEYHELYKENADRAFVELRNRLSDELKTVMVHIESEEDYEAIDELRSIINGKFSDSTKEPKLFRDRKLISDLNKLSNTDNSLYKKICSLSLSIKTKSEELKTDYRSLEKENHSLFSLLVKSIILVIGFPVFLFGSIFNILFMGIPVWKSSEIKDPQFVSTFKFGFSVVLTVLIMSVILILSMVFSPQWWISLLIFISFPIASYLAWNYYILYKRIRGGFRVRKLFSSGNKLFQALNADYKELINLIQKYNVV